MSTANIAKTKEPSSWRDAKMTEKRRGVRMNSRVPVAVEWAGQDGKIARSKAYTCVVSSYGCLVVLPENLMLDQQVLVVNLATEQTIPGTIVWRGNFREEGWELGIELSQPPLDFWGLDL